MAAQNFPAFANPFIGRTDELGQIAARLRDPDCRLLTLAGPGGIGKTRLAIEVARLTLNTPRVGTTPAWNAPLFSDGACFVPLQPLTAPDFIVPAIADALHFTFRGDPEPKQQILDHLQGKRLLLVLDNFEHLTEGVDLLPEMLAHAPNLRILVTSRERLRLREEWVVDIGGLNFPENTQMSGWENFTAVQLFLHCARRVGYVPAEADTASIARICRAVEGIPLAVELAAAWVRVMPCADIAREIEHSLDILTTSLRNVPERHRSMRAAFERSWDLLTAEEQPVFRRLSVFRGGFTREGAGQVAGATLPILASLVDKSVVRVDASGRYDLHELLRQYAADKLLQAGEVDTTARRHRDCFLNLAEEAEAHVFGREQIAWFDRLEVDFDNLRTALLWSLRSGDTETGLRLAGALGWFFSERAHWNEGLDWLERMLAASPDAPASLRAKALHSAGALAGWIEDDRRLRALCEQALALARAANDRWNTAWSLSQLGNYMRGDPARSAALLEESLALFRALGDAMGITHTLVRRAWKAIQVQRDYGYGRALLEEAMIGATDAGDKVMIAWVQYMLGLIAWLQDNDLRQARSCFESCERLFREARTPFYNVIILLADVDQATGNAARAQRLYEESLLSLRGTLPDHTYLSWVLAGLVSAARSLGQLERAARLLGAANGLALNEKRNSHDIAHFDLGEAAVAAVRDQLGEAAFAEAWAAGHGMTPAQIIAYVLEDRTTPGETGPGESSELPDTAPAAGPSRTTPVDASSPSNRDTAGQLFLTADTERQPRGGIPGTPQTATHVQAVVEPDAQERQLLFEALTSRELEVLRLVAEGLSNRDIAQALTIVEGTVRSHVYNLCQKLGARNRTQAVARARALRIL